jgi:hypothetical protein
MPPGADGLPLTTRLSLAKEERQQKSHRIRPAALLSKDDGHGKKRVDMMMIRITDLA